MGNYYRIVIFFKFALGWAYFHFMTIFILSAFFIKMVILEIVLFCENSLILSENGLVLSGSSLILSRIILILFDENKLILRDYFCRNGPILKVVLFWRWLCFGAVFGVGAVV